MMTLEKWVGYVKELQSTDYEAFSIRRNELLSKNILDTERYRVPNLITRSGPYNNYEEISILLPTIEKVGKNRVKVDINPSVYCILKDQPAFSDDSGYEVKINTISKNDGRPLNIICRYNAIILQWTFGIEGNEDGETEGNYFMQISAPQKYDDVSIYCRKRVVGEPFIRVMEGLEYMQDGILHRCNILGKGLNDPEEATPFFKTYCSDVTTININHSEINSDDDSAFTHMVYEMRKKEYPYGKMPPKVQMIYP